MDTTNIEQTLKDNIREGILNLAVDALPGPVQAAIGYYLNGITIPIGSVGSLSVMNTGGKLTLNMQPVSFVGTVSADTATLQISGTGSYSDASITVSFTKNGNGVDMNLTATMGESLTWKISDLWPALLNKSPFTELSLTKGNLTLSTSTGTGEIDFTGNGSVQYQNDALASGIIRVLYGGKKTESPDTTAVSFLLGVVVPSWSPGTIWSQLNDVTFTNSGLLFSSIPLDKSSTISDYGLINKSAVPAIVNGDFKVDTGITFFTNLQLEKFLAPLADLLGESQSLALYANRNLEGDILLMATFGASGFKPSPNAIFEFEGFSLTWNMTAKEYDLTAAATGKFFPPDGSVGGITLVLSGTIKPQEGDITIALEMQDWINPFGYKKLAVNDLAASFSMGGSSEGVTIGLSGDFEFTATMKDGVQKFQFGMAGEITDFETPTGIAFLLQSDSPGKEITLGSLVDGISGVDVSSIPAIQVIDKLLRVRKFDFAIVLADSLTVGTRKFEKGFTLNAEFDILQQENITIDVEFITSGKNDEFTALADLAQPVEFGKVLTLTGYDFANKKPMTTVGPEVAVSSKGVVVTGVNNDQPVYFYLSAYMEFLDVIQASLYGLATKEYLFEFIFDVTAGEPHGSTGVWAGEAVTIGLDPQAYTFVAVFYFDFGWLDQSLGPISLFGYPLIPKVSLPNFSISAGLSVNADGKALTFVLAGDLNFTFLDVDLQYGSPESFKTIINLDLRNAPQKLDDIKDEIWSWLQQNISPLMEGALSDFDTFVAWIKKEAEAIGFDVIVVARILYGYFNKKAPADIAAILKTMGYTASEIYHALVEGLNIAASDAQKIVDDIFDDAKNCAAKAAAKIGLNL